MPVRYFVEVFEHDHGTWVAELRDALDAEVSRLGLHHSVEVVVAPPPVAGEPSVGIYLGSPAAAADQRLSTALATALGRGRSVIPVVAFLGDFSNVVPPVLRAVNGWEWSGRDPAMRLARRLLEELGIEEQRRRVFISHRREDGLAAAEQLYDYLHHHGFEPFIDRFSIRLASDVQKAIADALEDFAFLLLLETPRAHESDWVFYEVEYALAHQLGLHIVTWPGDTRELPATHGLSRWSLQTSQLQPDKGYDVLTDEALDAVLADVERIHAGTIARRRRYLLVSTEEAAVASGCRCTPLPGWRLLVETPSGTDVVQVSTRLPRVVDLYGLDKARTSGDLVDAEGVLVHSARALEQSRRDLLRWAVGTRALTLVPENAIGGYWLDVART
jgi:TIR domain